MSPEKQKRNKTKNNMKLNKLVLLAVCTAVAVLTGCMSTPAGYVASNVPVSQGQYTVVKENVSGIDSQISILFFSAAKLGSAQRRAVQDALASAPGADALVDMAIDYEIKSFGIGNIRTIRVTGTAVKTK